MAHNSKPNNQNRYVPPHKRKINSIPRNSPSPSPNHLSYRSNYRHSPHRHRTKYKHYNNNNINNSPRYDSHYNNYHHHNNDYQYYQQSSYQQQSPHHHQQFEAPSKTKVYLSNQDARYYNTPKSEYDQNDQHFEDSKSLRSFSDSHSQHSEFLDVTNEFINNDEEDTKMEMDPMPKVANEKIKKEKSENDIAFEQYLIKYKEEHKQTYIAPFLSRRLRKEYDFATKERMKQLRLEQREAMKQRTDDWIQKQHPDDEDNKEESQINRTYPDEYLFFRNYYEKNSKKYIEWQDMRHDGWHNAHLEKFFNLKHKNQDNKSRSSEKNIVSLFRRFYRYAIDIDNCCSYRQDLISILQKNQNKDYVYFLDIGFAPGGMSRLLLDANAKIYGVGLTLPPYECGNAYIQELLYEDRFLSREHDIVELAKKVKNRSDFLTHCIQNDYATKSESSVLQQQGWHRFGGFDLIIVGITLHQDFNSNERLDHQILLSELYIAFLTLNEGGSILIRHKIALDCIHQHILFIFLKCFGDYQSGKPLTEFAIRKTFWILWKGFDRNKCQKLKIVQGLRRLIQNFDPLKPPYGKNPETQQYYNPHMIEETPQQIVDELDGGLINVMDPVFEIQMKSLRSYCSGKKDRLCSGGRYCKMADCNRAHVKEECIDGFYDALINVDHVMNEEVLMNKHHSRILMSLDKRMQQRQHKQYRNHYNNENVSSNWRRIGDNY